MSRQVTCDLLNVNITCRGKFNGEDVTEFISFPGQHFINEFYQFYKKFHYLEIRTNRNQSCHETISEEEGGPDQLTLASTGGAEEFWYSSLGVYSKTGERHNNKTVWARHHGNQKIFFNECEIYQMHRNNNSNVIL